MHKSSWTILGIMYLLNVFVFLFGRYGIQLAKRDFRVLELHSIEVQIAAFWSMMSMLWDPLITLTIGMKNFSNRSSNYSSWIHLSQWFFLVQWIRISWLLYTLLWVMLSTSRQTLLRWLGWTFLPWILVGVIFCVPTRARTDLKCIVCSVGIWNSWATYNQKTKK